MSFMSGEVMENVNQYEKTELEFEDNVAFEF